MFSAGYGDKDAFMFNMELVNQKITDGLAIFDGIFCPHYQNSGMTSFHSVIKNYDKNGYAVENGACLKIKNGEFSKKYYAIVKGIIPKGGRLENYLIKDEQLVKSFVGNERNGKLAILDYEVIKTLNNTTLVDVSLKTGRHHQIRVQFSHINHPLIGDKLYGENSKCDMCLYAYGLSFNHPVTKERLSFEAIPNHSIWNKYFE